MTKIIACVDGSSHSKSVCDLSSWIARNTDMEVSLLHVAIPHDEVAAKTDLTGSIGLGAKHEILEELSKLDEEHGKLEQKKGNEILDKSSKLLEKNKIHNIHTLHRRGSFEETILELQENANLFIIGKNGEAGDTFDEGDNRIGGNVKSISTSIKKPLLVTTKNPKPIKKFLIAYDGSANSLKSIKYVAQSPLFKNLEGHLLKIDKKNLQNEETLQKAKNLLEKSNLKIQQFLKDENNVEDAITNHIKEHDIDLLVIGSHGHSIIRNFILGSTTNHLIHKSKVPVLLIRS